jgi:N-6 DNA Methylase
MAAIDPNAEWIGNVQPIGLVLAVTVLARHGLNPAEQTRADSEAVRALLSDNDQGPALPAPWAFFTQILGWRAAQVAGVPGGPALPADLSVRVEECDTDLTPHWAVADLDKGWQILVRIEGPGVDPEKRGALEGWEATPHQQLERLLREKEVPTGLLLTDSELRFIYAPRRETSGWLKFPIRSLCEVGGRPMLGGLKLILSSFRLHNDAPDRRLASLLKASRDAQAEVSTRLAAQVLGALHELLRGLHSADRARTEALAASRPEHLYEGLLTVLLRLVFLLYAEDRDLIPSRTDGEARALYDQGYGVRSLYMCLLDDAALHPDTMDERRGAWSRLLALFRLVHGGDGRGWIRGRGGKLFDPEAFPFLQGQDSPSDEPSPATLSDGCILRILDLLLSLDGERLSYRTLDVEQIGSVYETVMGFTVETRPGPALAIRAGKNDRTPVFVDVAALTAKKGAERAKFLKEEADRNALTDKVGKALATATDAGSVIAALRPIVDERGSPGGHVMPPGTPLLQPTDERRRTGSHYTPRSLTGPIVQHALEPAFARLGPDARPEAVLELKVCDPAMGSGAFLVEACRALAERVVQAWTRWPETRPTIPADEDEHLHARRLVAQRCLYGVDKNPLATDLAKLSLWLATLARDHEFTFLDHALKSGDSLVGLTQAQIAAVHWDTSKPGLPLFRQLVKDRVTEAMKGRAEIQAAPDDTARVIQEQRHRSLEERLREIRLVGDAVIAAFFAEVKPKAREKTRAEVESWLSGSPVAWDKLAAMAATLKQGAHPLTPFYWEIEFPEVFARENGGFDAIVGNPPFLGGTRITEQIGDAYNRWLAFVHENALRRSDLIAHFFRKSFVVLRSGGTFGLIATNTIGQGDTRDTGLSEILASGGTIIRAIRRLKWPGEAAVTVSVVHLLKGAFNTNPRWPKRKPNFGLPCRGRT